MRFSRLAATLLALPVAVMLACGGKENVQTVETDEGTVTIDHDEGTLTFSAEGGKKLEMKTGENVELPEDFPEDIPVYPDATVVTSMAAPDGLVVSLRSTAGSQDVLAFYKKQLADGGWKVEMEMNMGEQRMISFSKGERQVMLTAASEEGQTQISLTASR